MTASVPITTRVVLPRGGGFGSPAVATSGNVYGMRSGRSAMTNGIDAIGEVPGLRSEPER